VEPFSEVELGVLAFVRPHVVHEVSLPHSLDRGGTWDLVPVMQPENGIAHQRSWTVRTITDQYVTGNFRMTLATRLE